MEDVRIDASSSFGRRTASIALTFIIALFVLTTLVFSLAYVNNDTMLLEGTLQVVAWASAVLTFIGASVGTYLVVKGRRRAQRSGRLLSTRPGLYGRSLDSASSVHLEGNRRLHGWSDETQQVERSATEYINESLSKTFRQKAISLQEREDYQSALQAVEQALHYDPGNFDALYIKGTILSNLGRIDDALESYTKAAEARKTILEQRTESRPPLKGEERTESPESTRRQRND